MQSTVTRALQAMIYPPASRHRDISGHGLTGTSEDKRTKLGCPSSAGAGQSGRFMTWCGRSCVWGLKASSPQISWYIMSLTWVIIVFPINSTLFRGINGYLRITCNLGKLWDICFPKSSIFQNTTSLLNGSLCPHLGPSDDLGCLDHAEAEFAQVLALQRRQVGGSLLVNRWVR